ncbi:MAG: hypothetical protein Q9187_001787 [Circinaria calcarea]
MTLEDFEKSLGKEGREQEGSDGRRRQEKGRERRKHHHKHRREHRERGEDQHRHKRRRHSKDDEGHIHDSRRSRHEKESNGLKREISAEQEDEWVEKGTEIAPPTEEVNDARSTTSTAERKRDTWMEDPAAIDIDYVQMAVKKDTELATSRPGKPDFDLKIHENELNKHHLQSLADGNDIPGEIINEPAQHEVNYTFGDAGAQWRMTKLKSVYRQAEESGESIDDLALERYGDLRAFDDAREEEIELGRRETYGEDYVGKEKPSGELFQERKLDLGIRQDHHHTSDKEEIPPAKIEVVDDVEPPSRAVQLDQTTLNRLKAQMMKAKLRGSPNAPSLEAEYNLTAAGFTNRNQSDLVILGTMENRMLAGGRKGEVKNVENRRGLERGLVEENEDMSIEDMVREERRTRGQAGGEGQRFAERIAKDAKFDNDLDYMDENAFKLAKRVHKSEINLRNTAISDYQKLNRILDNCPLCHHEDTGISPIAPVVSLATRTYLTLLPEPEISPGGACIVPIQHHTNLLDCDDDEWEEIRNFMKSVTRMYHSRSLSVLFYENAAHPHTHPHALLNVIPLPASILPTAPAFFREAILSSSPEWSQHRKLIDTLSAAKKGLGKNAFRRSLVKQAPYFHVWFELDGGMGHVVEEGWPGGDRFAREVLGGMLGVDVGVVRAKGRWEKGDRRVESFRKGWEKWDWTKVLLDG